MKPRPEIFVDTSREGMLALLGHDLRLTAHAFELSANAGAISATVELASLRVIGSTKQGRLDPSAPSTSERAEIEQRMRDEILDVARYPMCKLTGQVRRGEPGFLLSGTLELRGRAQPLQVTLREQAGALEGSFIITPSHHGVAPFRALGGALRIADRVAVRVSLPLEAMAPGSDLAALTARWQRTGDT